MFYLNIFQVQMSSKERSSRPPKQNFTNNTATELVSSESQCSIAWTSRWWWATEWISVIWHSSTDEVCRTVSVSHMSAQCVLCKRVWRSTFLHAGHVVLSWTWKNTHGENINLHLKQGAAVKAGFGGID